MISSVVNLFRYLLGRYPPCKPCEKFEQAADIRTASHDLNNAAARLNGALKRLQKEAEAGLVDLERKARDR